MPDHSSIQQLLSEATAQYHSGDYRQAIQTWQRVLSSEPNNQRAQEGIRMASLLLEEAQSAAESSTASHPSATEQESSANIARVRDGIQKVREYLASSRHLEAMEVCQSLLGLAPHSAAVHEIVDEAREAYEAQPFINEHLEIARQLFVQERLDEATAELHKIFFLNSNHGEARKLEAKILALKQKRVPGALPAESPEPGQEVKVAPPDPAAASQGDARIADTQDIPTPPDFGDAIDLPLETGTAGTPASSPEPGAAEAGPGKAAAEPDPGENWEAELAQLDMSASATAPSAAKEAQPPAPEEAEDRMPLMDLSEDPALAGPPPVLPQEPEMPSASTGIGSSPGETHGDLDLSALLQQEAELQDDSSKAPAREPGKSPSAASSTGTIHERGSRRGPGSPILRYLLPLLGVLIGGGAAWWYLGMQTPSSGGGAPPSPPPARSPRQAGAAGSPSGERGGGANLGLSSSGSRATGSTASAGVPVPGVGSPPPPAAPVSPEEARREIARYAGEGHSLMEQGRYKDAVKAFTKVLDLDPANMEAKDQLDQAAGKVMEQKKLEDDLQTAKEFFVEKDYESALRKFYRLPRDRNLGNLDLFIRNAWYDWAVVAMKGGNCVDALQRLKEALTLDPEDQEALKQQEVAEHYKDRPKDRIYYAFTDRLTYRTLDQR